MGPGHHGELDTASPVHPLTVCKGSQKPLPAEAGSETATAPTLRPRAGLEPSNGNATPGPLGWVLGPGTSATVAMVPRAGRGGAGLVLQGALGPGPAFSEHQVWCAEKASIFAVALTGEPARNGSFLPRTVARSFSGQQVAVWSHEGFSPPPFALEKNCPETFPGELANCFCTGAGAVPSWG